MNCTSADCNEGDTFVNTSTFVSRANITNRDVINAIAKFQVLAISGIARSNQAVSNALTQTLLNLLNDHAHTSISVRNLGIGTVHQIEHISFNAVLQPIQTMLGVKPTAITHFGFSEERVATYIQEHVAVDLVQVGVLARSNASNRDGWQLFVHQGDGGVSAFKVNSECTTSNRSTSITTSNRCIGRQGVTQRGT